MIPGREIAVYRDANNVATHVTGHEFELLSGQGNCTGIDLGSPVYKGSKLIGHTMFETKIIFRDAKLAFVSGQKSASFGYRRALAEEMALGKPTWT